MEFNNFALNTPMSHFYSISIAILAMTLVNLWLTKRMKNSFAKRVSVGLNTLALIVLFVAIIFKAFNR